MSDKGRERRDWPGWLGGRFAAVFASRAGEVRVEWTFLPERELFLYHEEPPAVESQLWIGRAAGLLVVEEWGEEWAVLSLVRGREGARLLALCREKGLELIPLASLPHQLLVLPLAGRLSLERLTDD